MDKTKLTNDTYNACAESYLRKYTDFHLYDDAYELFVKYIKPGSSLLDLGCGPGAVSKYISKKVNVKLTLMDLSEKMIELAKIMLPSAETVISDIRTLSFKENSYEFILAAFCLPFLYDEEAKIFIKEIASIVKSGGYIYLSTMEGKGNEITTTSFSDGGLMFLNYYSPRFLDNEFAKNNLKVVENIRKNYPELDGSFTVDMIYILKKN